MIYIASPYSSPIPELEDQRALAVSHFALFMLQQGQPVFSPIAYGHPFHRQYGMPGDAAFWWDFNVQFIRRANQMFVLCLPGWQESKGVYAEIKLAEALRLPTTYFNAAFEQIDSPIKTAGK